MKKKVELLAPAGNMESLKAAVSAGCDAVYLGLTNFSARAFAGNFTHEEFQEAISYCHIRDVRVYVTINTMLYEPEIENAKKEVNFLYNSDCDAILVQDMGLFHYIRTCYPDFEVHCSTQMHIHNINGVKQMQKEGAARVVLARETPIEIIREACMTGMDIEVFAYGAICISYSGQCLMSESLKHRSANRGMCAQCCRLQYYSEEGKHFNEGDYILSPKDLNVINRLPELLDAGVASLKIEGRMKRPEYVWLVTRTFREAMDAYDSGRPYKVSEERQRELLLMFNRGFTEGHIFHASEEERMSQYRPNHRGVEIGRVLSYSNGKVTVKLSAPLYQHDGLRILNEPQDTGLTSVKIFKNGKLVNGASAGEIVTLPCVAKPSPKKGQPLLKTSDSHLLDLIRDCIQKEDKKSFIKMKFEAKIGKPFYLKVTDNRGNSVESWSDQISEKAMKSPVSKDRICSSLSKIGDMPFLIQSLEGVSEEIFLPISIINEVRRNALDELIEKRKCLNPRKGKLDYQFELAVPPLPSYRMIIQSDEPIQVPSDCVNVTEGMGEGHVLPPIHESLNEEMHNENCILSSMGDLFGTNHNVIAGMNLNIANSYAIAYMLSKGCDAIVFSSEIHSEQIRTTLDAFKDRYGFVPATYKLVYGRRAVMYIKDSFLKNHSIKDMCDMHGDYFPLSFEKDITRIYEPRPYTDENSYSYGSYIIVSKNQADLQEIIQESWEEIQTRLL